MRLLAVDDSAVIRKIVRGAAEVLEMEMLEAEDGFEALARLEAVDGKVDIILLDWNMPKLSGYEVLQKLKANPKYKKIPVMMVTTESQNENIVKAIQAGASNYVIKPFTMDELTKKIMESLGRGGF